MKPDQNSIWLTYLSSADATSEVPFDRRYTELSPARQRQLKSARVSMDEDDEPPYPVEGLRRIYALLIKEEPRLLLTAPLSSIVEVDATLRPWVCGSQCDEAFRFRFAASVFDRVRAGTQGQGRLCWRCSGRP